MAERDRSRAARIEASFRAQYSSLDDETLRQIASGAVPWVQDGAYLFEARRAARAVLASRGVRDLPKVPAWDPRAVDAPGWVRLAVGLGAVVVMSVAAGGYLVVFPPAEIDVDRVCDETRRALSASATARRVGLVIDDCHVAPSDAGGQVVIDGCVTPKAADALASRRDQVLGGLLRAFASAPAGRGVADANRAGQGSAAGEVAGQRCAEAVVADVVAVRGRPWFVRLR